MGDRAKIDGFQSHLLGWSLTLLEESMLEQLCKDFQAGLGSMRKTYPLVLALDPIHEAAHSR